MMMMFSIMSNYTVTKKLIIKINNAYNQCHPADQGAYAALKNTNYMNFFVFL